MEVKMNSPNGSVHHIESQRKDEHVHDREPSRDLEYIPEGAPVAGPRLVGSDLIPADDAALEARWIDRESADRAQLRRADSLIGAEVVGRKNGNYAGILIPISTPLPPGFASIACVETSRIWNTILPAISNSGKNI
jgi:hypothetical protein